MIKTHRDFKGRTFYRKFGTQNLRYYIQGHPLQAEIANILDNSQDNTFDFANQVHEIIDSSNNPNRDQDRSTMALINDMSGEKGHAVMLRVCRECDLEHLLTDGTTPHGLAFELFQHHKTIFDLAYTLLWVDQVEGWQVYMGTSSSLLKDNLQTAKRDFQDQIIPFLRNAGYGSAFQVEEYQQHERLILDIRYAGHLVRHEDFDAEGRLKVNSIRKPLDIGLVYYPATGVLKVKTPRGQGALNKTVYNAFATSYLQNADALLTLKLERAVNLEELKNRRSFPCDNTAGVKQASVTSLRFSPYIGSKAKITINDKFALWSLLERIGNVHDIEIASVNIQFEFEGKGNSRFRTVSLNSENQVGLGANDRDDIISEHLKRWGLINV